MLFLHKKWFPGLQHGLNGEAVIEQKVLVSTMQPCMWHRSNSPHGPGGSVNSQFLLGVEIWHRVN